VNLNSQVEHSVAYISINYKYFLLFVRAKDVRITIRIIKSDWMLQDNLFFSIVASLLDGTHV